MNQTDGDEMVVVMMSVMWYEGGMDFLYQKCTFQEEYFPRHDPWLATLSQNQNHIFVDALIINFISTAIDDKNRMIIYNE